MSYRLCKIGGMNLNREQFLKAVERGQTLLKELKKDYPELSLKPVFSRFGPRSGQCDLTVNLRQIILDFPEMLRWNATSGRVSSFGGQASVLGDPAPPENEQLADSPIKRLRGLLFDLKKAEKEKEEEPVSKLRKQCDTLEAKLLAPDLLLYCGDILIEYRPENLKYESLRRLQQDSRLPSGLNTVGNIRVIAGSLKFLSKEV